MSSEPSQRAKDVAPQLFASSSKLWPSLIQSALDAERAELEAQVREWTERHAALDRLTEGRIAELNQEIQAMAALLNRVPHRVGNHSSGRPSWRMAAGFPEQAPCEPDCPACAWAKLKQGQ